MSMSTQTIVLLLLYDSSVACTLNFHKVILSVVGDKSHNYVLTNFGFHRGDMAHQFHLYTIFFMRSNSLRHKHINHSISHRRGDNGNQRQASIYSHVFSGQTLDSSVWKSYPQLPEWQAIDPWSFSCLFLNSRYRFHLSVPRKFYSF